MVCLFQEMLKTKKFSSFKNTFLKILPVILIITIGIITYGGTLHNTFQFDDEFFVVKNPVIRHITDFKSILEYDSLRFVGYLSFAANYHFHQLRVEGYHVVNIIIHILAAICAYWISISILLSPIMKKERISGYKYLIAAFIGLIFVSHPVQTQAVTYIWQRVASMATLFYLLSLGLYLKARLSKNNKIFFALSAIVALLAMFTKQMTFTLPFVALLCEIFFFNFNIKTLWKKTKYKWIWIVLLIIFIGIIPYLSKDAIHYKYTTPDKSESFDGEFTTGKNFLISQFKVMWIYLRLLVVPIRQNLDYEVHVAKSFFEPKVLSGFLFLCFLFFSVFKLFKKYRLASFGILFFLLAISIEAGAVPIDCLIYEHRLYLPMAGYSIFLVSSLFYLITKKSLKTFVLIVISIIIAFSILTIRRNKVWTNNFTLWDDVIKKSPTKMRAYNNRGKAYAEMGMQAKSVEDFSKAISLEPDRWLLYINRGVSLENLGKYSEAMKDYEVALKNGNDSFAYNSRAHLYMRMRVWSKAIKDYTKAIEINPNNLQGFINRAIAYVQLKKYDEAIEGFSEAIRLDPYYVEAYNNRADTYSKKGDINSAINDFNKAISINPNNLRIRYNRGLTLVEAKKYKDAINDFTHILNIVPDYIKGYTSRGVAYFSLGDIQNALKDFDKVLELDDKRGGGYFNRGVLYLKVGERQKALEDFTKARKLGFPVDNSYLQ
ncbi:MAG: tetratricopeptide repeat protein [Candidatus Zapsychrus exili]|nr:tetratricopeptide repeat protein [Candidatus Zapsychrus exili]